MSIESIRRAASVARYHDRRVAVCKQEIQKIVNEGLIDKHDDYIVDLECNANNIWYHSNIAAEVRRAIREVIKP